MALTPLPAAPSRSDAPDVFIQKANAWLAAQAQFVNECNAQAAALTLASTNDTSASSVLIGLGSKSFTVSTGKSFQPGMWLNIADAAAPSTNSMHAQITSYNSGTGALVVNVTSLLGSGTKTAWTISQSAPGAASSGNNSDILSLLACASISGLGTVNGLPFSASIIGELFAWPSNTTPANGLICNGAAVSRTTYASLFAKLVTEPGFSAQTFTVTIASPAVVTKTAHGLVQNSRVRLSTSGALPTGLSTGIDYYVKYVDANTFQLSSSMDGTAINTSGTQSGTHTYTQSLHGLGDGSTTFNLPNIPADYALTQYTAGNEGAGDIGQVISHIHGGVKVVGSQGGAVNTGHYGDGSTAATGGTINKAAGVRVRWCIRF